MSIIHKGTKIASNAVTGDTLPIGSQVPFGSLTIPDNWLLCDGRAISRLDYSELFAVIGTSYGAGNGTTTFNLPNKKGRTSVGLDTSQTEFNTVGKTGGAKTHHHTFNSMPSEGTPPLWEAPNQRFLYRYSKDNPYQVTIGTGGEKDSSLQPYQTDVWIIKAKQSAGVVATVVDTLTSTSPTNALSANMGRELDDKIKPVLNIWSRAIIGIDGGNTIIFNQPLVNGLYNLYFARSVATQDIGMPVTFAIYNNNETWVFLNSFGWVQEANADAIVRRNIKISRTGIYSGSGSYNRISDGSFSENPYVAIPYKIDLLLKY